MVKRLTPEDESYRADFISALTKQGVPEDDSQKSVQGIIYDPKFGPVEKAALHLAAKEMCRSLRPVDSFGTTY